MSVRENARLKMEQELRWPIYQEWLQEVIDGVVNTTDDRVAEEVFNGVIDMVMMITRAGEIYNEILAEEIIMNVIKIKLKQLDEQRQEER